MESVVQLPHLRVFARRGPEFAENRGHVRPSSSVAATIEREKARICRSFSEPSDGLEPSTPSLPCARLTTGRNQRQRFSLVSAVSGAVRFATGCHRLRPRGSIKAPSFVANEDDIFFFRL